MPSFETNRKNFEAAKEQGNIVPAVPVEIPKPVPVATYPASPNPHLRTPLPAISVQQPDSQRQWQTGATPQQRILPSSQTGNPVTAAQTISNIIAVGSTSVAAPVTDIESIAINKQTGTSYTVQTSDLDTLITFNNNSGGLITLPGPSAPFASVQSVYFGAGAGTASTTITNTKGNFMFMQVDASDNFANPPTVADTNLNTWVRIGSQPNGGITSVTWWYAANIKPGANTITVTNFSSTVFCIPVLGEYSGVSPTPFDQTTSNPQPGGNIVTTTSANQLVIMCSSTIAAGLPPTYGVGWTGRIVTAAGQLLEDQIVVTPGTIVSSTASEATFPASVQLFILASFRTFIGPSSINFPAGWFTYIENTGTGTFTVTSTALIDGGTQNITLPPNSGVMVVYDGTNWYTERGITIALPVSVTNGGTGANLSATGGASQVLKQTSVGGAITVGQLAASDLSNGTTGSGNVVLASTPSISSMAMTGHITTYNNVVTVSGGVPAEYAAVNLTGQTANIGPTTMYTTPNAIGDGMYRISAYVIETTIGSISSTLPTVQIVYTDPATGVTINATPTLAAAGLGQTGALNANTVATTASGVVVINVAQNSAIQYQTVNYASNAAGMQYSLHIRLEAL